MKTGGAGMTNKEAIKIIDALIFQAYLEYEVARIKRGKIDINNRYNALTLAKEALEKQIPKKPYKRKEHKSKDYYCAICERYLGDEMELKFACLQPEYCEHCGQALDWSD